MNGWQNRVKRNEKGWVKTYFKQQRKADFFLAGGGGLVLIHPKQGENDTKRMKENKKKLKKLETQS